MADERTHENARAGAEPMRSPQVRRAPAVLIVGAGPTGLTLACELARRGVSCRLIERQARAAEGSRGKGVQPRSLEIFDDLGIAEELIAGGRSDLPLLVHGEGGAKLLDERPARREGAPYRSTLLTPQWRVEALLRSRFAELGGRVEWGSELVTFEQANDRVVARVRTGGRDEVLEAKWLVGCDGGQSTVRRRLGLPFIGETFERLRMWVGDLEVAGLDRDYWHIWRDRQGFLALCPLPGTGQFQFQAQIPGEESREPSLEAFQQLVRQRTGRDDIRFSRAGWMSRWRANVRMVDRFRVGRVLLAGDAAHVHSPAGAQGMNTGVQDAYNLGWKIAAVTAGADERLVDTYQEERLPVAAWVLGLSSELTQTAFSPDLRRDGRTTQLDLDYRAGSLSVDLSVDMSAASSTIRAGDRAPDATGLRGPDGTRRRLFDLLHGTHATVLVFGSELPALDGPFQDRFGDRVRLVRIEAAGADAAGGWTDEDGAAHRIYRPAPNALFVIRPDGYVGLTGLKTGCDDLVPYLRGIIGPRHASVPGDAAAQAASRPARLLSEREAGAQLPDTADAR